MIGTLGGVPPHTRACSRAACTSEADWSITWRNPKIHDTDRHKVWLACDEHLEYLREFLAARDFPLSVEVLPRGSSTLQEDDS